VNFGNRSNGGFLLPDFTICPPLGQTVSSSFGCRIGRRLGQFPEASSPFLKIVQRKPAGSATPLTLIAGGWANLWIVRTADGFRGIAARASHVFSPAQESSQAEH
jgi:hypothetical protein